MERLYAKIDTSAEHDMQALREAYPYVFDDKHDSTRPRKDTGVTCEIELAGPYRRTHFYSVPRHQEEHLTPILVDLEDRGVIQRCTRGQYVAPMLVVKKKNGKIRLCIDFRDLNSVTVPFYYPLPRIDVIRQDMQGYIFRALDFQNAYHQVAVHPEDVCKTAVTTHKGLFESNALWTQKCAIYLSMLHRCGLGQDTLCNSIYR